MNLKAVLLGFLMRRDLTGYELKEAMDESVGYFFGASYGSIYPALRDMEGAGLVRSTEVVQSGRPNKKVYAITPEGRAEFLAALEQPPAEDSFRSESLMHLFFGDYQDPERVLALLRGYRSSLQRSQGRLRETEERIRDVPQARYGLMCLQFGLVYHENTLAWLEEVEEEVRAEVERRKRVQGRSAGGR